MSSQFPDKERLVEFWIESSDEDFDTMLAMHAAKKYTWALFIGHLVIEKLLKALFVKMKGEMPPFIHNLLRLAEKCDLNLNDDQKTFFATVTAFNINTRYDDFKKEFSRMCTSEFTAGWVNEIKAYRQWIKALIKGS